MKAPTFDDVRLAGLRGSLKASRNSARDLATTAQTPCLRRRALAIVGADSNDAARMLGAPDSFGQSPFALLVGNRFESGLSRDHYASLIAAVRDQLGFPVSATRVADLDRDHPWPAPRSADFASKQEAVAARRRASTDALLIACLEDQPAAPNIILHPRLRLVVTDTVRDVEPDMLLYWPGTGRPRIAEAKSYVDLGHRTETSDLAKTRQQSAVYFLALEQAVERLHAAGRISDLDHARERLRGRWPRSEESDVPDDEVGLITVLRRPQRMAPSLGLERIRRDVELVERGFHRTPANLADLLATLPRDARLDEKGILERLPTRYEPAWCLGNCPIAPVCRDDAFRRKDPAYFGGASRSVLAPVGNLERAYQLANGSAEPATAAETAFAERARPLFAHITAARGR